jgi:protein-tyrosine-phosphatase
MNSSLRSILLACFAGACLTAQTSQAPVPKPTVVFVCEHGSAKSIIAAAEFSRMAKQNGLDVNVLARGTNPDAEIPALIRDGLRADGIDPGEKKPAKVSKDDLKGATRIVSFGPDLRPMVADGVTVADWSATPSVSENYTAARDYIRKQVEALLKDLKK